MLWANGFSLSNVVQGPIRRAAARQARQTAALTQGRSVTANTGHRERREREGAVAGETKTPLSTGLQGAYMRSCSESPQPPMCSGGLMGPY